MKKRLHYFDMLKGIAIFMVVMGHVLTFCVRGIDRAVLFKFIEQIHMPLFFFISGWFTFKLTDRGMLKIPPIGKRAIQLLVPMAVVSSLWIWYFPHSGLESPLVSTFSGLWGSMWKNGYWFTLVLFEIVLIYASLTPLFSRLRSVASSVSALIVIWGAMIGLLAIIPGSVSEYGSLELTVTFWPVFMSGVIASRHRDGFHRLTNHGSGVTIAILISAVLIYLLCWPWEFAIFDSMPQLILVVKSLFHFCIAIIAIAIVRPWSELAYTENASPFTHAIANIWRYVGQKSLGIYLLHYFFLFPMGVLRGSLEGINVAFTPLFWFSALVAAGIIAIVLGVIAIISKSPLLSLLLLGERSNK